MSGVKLPVTRPGGHVLLVGSPASRGETLAILKGMGLGGATADDPYVAFAEICRGQIPFVAVILCLASFYAEELQMIGAIKRRFPHLDVWLAQTDGRHSNMAHGIRLGADGLLSADGFHRLGSPAEPVESHANHGVETFISAPSNGHPRRDVLEEELEADSEANDDRYDPEMEIGAPLLTPEELRALLQEQPAMPPEAD